MGGVSLSFAKVQVELATWSICWPDSESAAELPIMFPAIFDFAINLVTARVLAQLESENSD
jgi:hypothetical protein